MTVSRMSRVSALVACCVLLSPVNVLGAAGVDIAPVSPVAVTVGKPEPLSAETCHCIVIPALTPVELEIMAPVGSKTSGNGDHFPIRLAKSVVIDGVEVLPAGLTGTGEVVHAKPSGGGGGGGELVLAARYLEMANGRVRLRSMRVSSVGKDQTGLALASSYAIGIFAMAVKGKNTEIPAGTLAEAKVAEALAVARPPTAVATASINGADAGVPPANIQK